MLGGALALNTVIDEERRLSFVNFGEIVASHLDGRRPRARVRRGAGAPSGSAPWSPAPPAIRSTRPTIRPSRAWSTPMEILAPGGDLIIASACSEGMGSAEFVDAQRRLVERGPERFLAGDQRQALRRHRRVADRDAAEADARRLRSSSIPTAWPRPSWPLTGVEMIPSVAAAVAASVARSRRPAGRGDPRGPLRGPGPPAGRLSAVRRMATSAPPSRSVGRHRRATCSSPPCSTPGPSTPPTPSPRCARPACRTDWQTELLAPRRRRARRPAGGDRGPAARRGPRA